MDHTQLAQTAGWESIRQLCEEAMAYGTASVCIPPSYIRQAKQYVGENMALCTVIGFPNGYSSTEVKVFETEQAVKDGADEIDMVINLGWVKDGLFDQVEQEIRKVKAACGGKILKVIIETCLLTREEKIRMCQVVTSAQADYIKTSTVSGTCGRRCKDQGGGRDLHAGRRPAFSSPGGQPAGKQPRDPPGKRSGGSID